MNKKTKVGIIALVLLLTIGFASVTTSLLMNGGAILGFSDNEFDIYFSSAETDEGGTAEISQTDRKSITFSTKTITDIDEEAVLDYEITNDSTQYSARGTVEFECDNGLEDYVTIQMLDITAEEPVVISPESSMSGKIKVKLKQIPPGAVSYNFTVTLHFDPISIQHHEAADYPNNILKDMILFDNPTRHTNPDLTTTSYDAEEPDGLYEYQVSGLGYGGSNNGGTTYYFRGDVTNNVVDFANKTWRIVRINEDGTIRLILDTFAFNDKTVAFNTNNGAPLYMYYTNADLIPTYGENNNSNITVVNELGRWYTFNFGLHEEFEDKLAIGNYFCEAAKVRKDEYHETGGNDMETALEYTPDLKCEDDNTGKGLVNTNIGLITYDELLFSGMSSTAGNMHHYLYHPANGGEDNNYSWWTMTPSGFFRSAIADDASVWFVGLENGISSFPVYYETRIRPVINLKSDVTATFDENTGHYVIDSD